MSHILKAAKVKLRIPIQKCHKRFHHKCTGKYVPTKTSPSMCLLCYSTIAHQQEEAQRNYQETPEAKREREIQEEYRNRIIQHRRESGYHTVR